MSEVDKHFLRFHGSNPLLTKLSYSVLTKTRGRASDFGIREMCRGHHPESCGVKLVEVLQVAFERLRTFCSENRSDRTRFARFKSLLKVRTGTQNHQLTF